MGLFHPVVQAAQTTTIYQVNIPSHAFAGSETPLSISVTVYYDNVVTNSRLIVGVLDSNSSPQRIVPGVVVSSTTPCDNQPGASALCAITIAKSSGIVRVDFQIGGIFGGKVEPGTWDLNVTSVLVNPQNNLIPGSVSSRSLKIDLTPVSLNVDVPSDVAVSVDGMLQPAGSTSMGVALGQHNITVPQFVNINQSTRSRFDHWSDGNPSTFRSIVITNSTTLQANYVTQNLLTLIGIQGDGTVYSWSDAEKNATFSTNQYEPIPGLLGALGLRLSFQGWYENGQLVTTSPNGAISMDKPHTLTARWRMDYSVVEAITLGTIAVVILSYLILERRNRTTPRRRDCTNSDAKKP